MGMNGRFCCLGAWVAGAVAVAMAAHAQTPEQKPLAGYITASDVATNTIPGARPTDRLRDRTGATIASPDPAYDVTPPPSRASSGQRWEKFNAEFAIQQKSPLLVKGAMEEAKYQLDSAAFAVKDFAKEVEDYFRVDYELRNLSSAPPRSKTLRPIYDTPFDDMMDNARFRSDVKLGAEGGGAFAGVRLVLPFGD